MPENDRQRVLMIFPSFGGGGAERVGVTLINSFDERKYDLFVITFEDKNDYFADIKRKIEHVCLEKKGAFDFFRLVLDVRKIMVKFQPEVVISLLHYFNFICGFAALSLKRNFTLVLCEHIFPQNLIEHSRFGLVKKYMISFLYNRADFVVAISQQMKQVLMEDCGIREEKIKVIYNPIPLNTIQIMAQQDVKHRFFENENNTVIISVGRLHEQKRFDQLLRAFAVLRDEKKNIYLIILGRGAQITELQALADELEIIEAVDFIGFQPNPYAWMRKSDLFVMSSDYEGFPMVLLEALACGLPIVSTDCPSGPREIIDQGRNGILVPIGDTNALAAAVAKILSTKGERERMSREALNSVDQYGQERIFSQYEGLWRPNTSSRRENVS